MGEDMKREEIEESVSKVLEANTYEQVNKNLYLTKYQKQVLEEYHIPFQDCQNSKELLFLLSDIIDDEEYDELENVAREIAEYDYYKK